MDFEAYSTNLGLFVKKFVGYYNTWDNCKINGQLVEKIAPDGNSCSWVFLKDVHEITSYEVLKKGADKHIGYTLKIASIANDEIPLNLTAAEVEYYLDDDDNGVWRNYTDYQALYKPVHEKTEDVWTAEPFTVKIIRNLHVDSYEAPQQMKVEVLNTNNFKQAINIIDLSSIVSYDEFERILTPEFLLHDRPCKISSAQVYSIVRTHIKNNINPATARISSDYDFCFDVKRKLAIKPYVNKTEIKTARGRSYSQPKFSTTTVQHKEVDLFEMTTQEKPHGKYTPIKGWEANSLKEMQEQVGVYLTALMNEINRQVDECSHCQGTGYVVGKIVTNERNA